MRAIEIAALSLNNLVLNDWEQGFAIPSLRCLEPRQTRRDT